MIDFLKNKYVRFAIAALIYLLWVIWVGSWWLIIGLGVVFDIYVTKKVNWSFWKKREGNNSTFIEWLDALIFAVIAVTLINIFLFQNYRIPTGSMEKSLRIGDHLFVSKVAYGPRIPNTPIAFPFTQHTIPVIKTRSWSNLILRPYKRLAGFGAVERFDPVVFNFPAGDTVVLQQPVSPYEDILRDLTIRMQENDIYSGVAEKPASYYKALAREQIWNGSDIVFRPVDRRENYVKRCVGVPGDYVAVKGGVLFVNDKEIADNGSQQTSYMVTTNGTRINPKAFERLNIALSDQSLYGSTYIIHMTKENASIIAGFSNVNELIQDLKRPGEYGSHLFPHNPEYPWNEDYYGPIWIPAKGSQIKLDSLNISIYERIIDVYEDNDLEIRDGKFIINGEVTDTYTFKMDYYWMMGDNRHNSLDSRFWGFVPEDHIVGKPKFIWLSIEKEASGLKKIRFNRMFRKIR